MSYWDRGLIYHVFGQEYDKVAAKAVSYSRRFTSLPVCVVTNLSFMDRDILWDKIEGIHFVEVQGTIHDNRNVKTSIIEFSPFEYSIYVDSDAVIQRVGIEGLFDKIGENDVILQLNSIKQRSDSPFFSKHYIPVFEKLSITFPVRVYQGGFFVFRKSSSSKKFFQLWNAFWKMGGCGRDMPALVCAVRVAQDEDDLKVVEITEKVDKFFASGGCSDHGNEEAIIQHRWSRGSGFFKKFDIPGYQPFKPFDNRQGLKYGT